MVIMAVMGITVVYFAFESMRLFANGMNLYSDLPDSEVKKMPKSLLLYAVYLVCFFCNTVLICFVIYVLVYLAIMTY